MSDITFNYQFLEGLAVFINNKNGSAYDLIESGESSGSIQYFVDVESEDTALINLEILSMKRFSAVNSSELVNPIRCQYVINTEGLDIAEGCIYCKQNELPLKSSSGYGLQGCTAMLQTSQYRFFGFAYKDSNGELHTIDDFIYPKVQGVWSWSYGGQYPEWNDFFNIFRSEVNDITCKFHTTHKWFTSLSTALKYLRDGDDSGDINNQGSSDVPERNINTLYLKSTVYRSATSSRTQAVKVESHRWEFDVQRYNDDGTEIEKWNRGVIGFVNDTNTGHYNLGFMENTSTKNLIKIRVDGVEVPKSSFSWVTGLTTYTENTKDVIEDQTYFYWSDISTNMYIFDTLYHAQQVIEGIEEGIVKMFEGDDLTNTHLNDNDLDFNTDMSDCFVLDQADVQALARRFNAYVTSDGSIISDLFVGLGIHENPIDCNIDLFEMPIDVSGFCETEHYIVKFSPRVTRNPDPERQPEE